MFSTFLAQTRALSYSDSARKSGVVLYRYRGYLEDVPTNQTVIGSEEQTTTKYIFYAGLKNESQGNTVALIGTYFSANVSSVQFHIDANPPNFLFAFDEGKAVRYQKGSLDTDFYTIYPHKYHKIVITQFLNSSDENRYINVTYRKSKDSGFIAIPNAELFMFKYSNCEELYYGQTCSGICDDSQCAGSGQCRDGITGDGSCNCLSTYRRPTCSEVCKAYKHCSGNGKCLSDGTCKCNTGYTGSDCSEITDVNKQSRTLMGVVFYSVLSACFIASTIVQFCKMQKGRPIAHIALFAFSFLRLISSIISIATKISTSWARYFTVLPIPVLAFVIIRGVLLIVDQFTIATPGLTTRLIHWSSWIVPIATAVLMLLGVFIPEGLHTYFTVLLPLLACSIYTCVFVIYQLYFKLKKSYRKMTNLFAHLASALMIARKYITCSAVFFVLDAIVTYIVNYPTESIIGGVEAMYYILIIIDVLCLILIGLENSSILNDLFESDNDTEFVAAGVATINDVEGGAQEEESHNEGHIACPQGPDDGDDEAEFATSPDNATYLIANSKLEEREEWNDAIRTLFVIGVVIALSAIIGVIYINPSRPTWELKGTSLSRMNEEKLAFTIRPNITIYNTMRSSLTLDKLKFKTFYKNKEVGSYDIIKEKEVSSDSIRSFIPAMTLNIGSSLAPIETDDDVLTPDGMLDVITQGESWYTVFGFIKFHSKFSCYQTIRVKPSMLLVDGKGTCDYSLSELSM